METKDLSGKLKTFYIDTKRSLKGNPLKQLIFVGLSVVVLVITLTLVQVAVRLFSQAAGIPSVFFSSSSITLPPNQSVKLMVDANGNNVAIVRVELTFNTSHVRLSNEITTSGPLSTVVEKTSRADANSTGKIVLVLGLPPASRDNPPTSTFELATIPLTAATSQTDVSTSISINKTSDNSTTRIVDFVPQFLSFNKSDLSITVNPTTSSSPTPTSGQVNPEIISNLSVKDTNNASDWSVQSNLQEGDLQYGDRRYTLSTIPITYRGLEWIRTANDSSNVNLNPLVTFSLSQGAAVYVAVDDRGGRPSWMGTSWSDTGDNLVNSESTARTFSIYVRNYSSGQSVSLGANSGGSMYTVMARASTGTTASPTPTSSFASPTPTSGPSPTPVSGCPTMLGDVNGDGTVNVLDIITIIQVYQTSPPANPCADLNGDNIVNVLDIIVVIQNYSN